MTCASPGKWARINCAVEDDDAQLGLHRHRLSQEQAHGRRLADPGRPQYGEMSPDQFTDVDFGGDGRVLAQSADFDGLSPAKTVDGAKMVDGIRCAAAPSEGKGTNAAMENGAPAASSATSPLNSMVTRALLTPVSDHCRHRRRSRRRRRPCASSAGDGDQWPTDQSSSPLRWAMNDALRSVQRNQMADDAPLRGFAPLGRGSLPAGPSRFPGGSTLGSP